MMATNYISYCGKYEDRDKTIAMSRKEERELKRYGTKGGR